MANGLSKEPLLTVKDVKARLKISRQTLWVLRKEGKLKALSIGGVVRFTEEELSRYLKKCS